MIDQDEKQINGPLDVLESLSQRPVPKKKQQKNIKLPKQEEDIIDNLEEIEENIKDIEEEEQQDDKEMKKSSKKFVVDKRKDNMVNRQDILNKIRKTMNVEILDKSSKPDIMIVEERENVPINTGKQVMINDIEEDNSDDDKDDNEEEKVDTTEGVQPNIEIQEEFEINIPVVQEEPKQKNLERKENENSPDAEDISEVDLTTAMIRTQKVADRLPKEREKIVIKALLLYEQSQDFHSKTNRIIQTLSKRNIRQSRKCVL